MPDVWQCTREDIPDLVALLSRGAPLPVSEIRLSSHLTLLFRLPHVFAWRSARGVLLGTVGRAWYSECLVASDIAFYCEDGCGAVLLRRFRDWAEQMGAKHIMVGSTTGIDYERTASLYERLGFAQVGTTHRRVIG